MNLDELTPLQLVRLMSAEDARVAPAVATQAEAIARAIEVIADRLRRGGRLIYVGAGTSGRLGVLDASECPPTFSAPPGQVVGVIAGGPAAFTQSIEGAEDHPEHASRDLDALHFGPNDVLVGIATSGRTPYVLAALAYARRLGAFAIGLACNADAELVAHADLAITPVVGPEVLSGSTRLKAGTATKMVLNMLSTGAMVLLSKTFGNLMVDMRATNEKLRLRANRIVRQLTGLDQTAAAALLECCNRELKTALVVQLAGVTPDEARARLQAARGQVRQAVGPAATLHAPPATDLYLGIDGGGTGTVALLVRAVAGAEPPWQVLGRGVAGPSNLNAIGVAEALRAVDEAVTAAFVAAVRTRVPVAAACLGLAGAGRTEEQALVRSWAERIGLAQNIEVMADTPLILAAGTPAGWGVALVAGTGSMAFARAADGKTGRAGGWGHLLGDEGSGYRLALAGLQAVVRAADGRGPATRLTEELLQALGLAQPADLVAAVYREGRDRATLAALAPVVLGAVGDGDVVAKVIVHQAAAELAELAVTAACQVGLHPGPVPLALAGGLLASSIYRYYVLEALAQQGLCAEPVAVVDEPALGAVRLAIA